MSFTDFNLSKPLMDAILERGFEKPTEIQSQSIPLLTAEVDIDFVGQAQTGTGKTAAFGIPLLEKINVNDSSVQALILSPTRELANQIEQEIKKFSKNLKVKSLCVYGGVSLENQVRSLRKDGPQVVIGTPGRVLDLIKRGKLKLQDAKYAVLDEADEMLDMGFFDDVKEILSNFSEKRKTWMFSATMPRPILALINDFLNNPQFVKVEKSTLSNENIEQKYFVVAQRDMAEAVCRIIDSLEVFYGIIFCRTKVDAKFLSDYLSEKGYPSDSLHGDLSQQQRDLTMKRFKNKKIQSLVCTDVAARGIDVDNLTHVINYGLPQDLESYVHRIGRTGRAGNKGKALSIITKMETSKVKMLKRMTKAEIEHSKLPTVENLKASMIVREFSKFSDIDTSKMDDSFEKFSTFFEEEDKENVLKLFFKTLFSEKVKRYDRIPSIDLDVNSAGSNASRSGYTRLFASIGEDHGVDINLLVKSISDFLMIDQKEVQNVLMKDYFSFLEIPSKFADEFLTVKNFSIKGRRVRFEATKDSRRNNSGGGRRSFSRNDRSGGGNAANGNRSQSSRGGRGGYGARRSSGREGQATY